MQMCKLVRRGADGNLYSLFDHRYCLRYIPNVPTVPLIGSLFVFANHEDAMDSCRMHEIELWNCETPRPTRYRRMLANPMTTDTNDDIVSLWRNRPLRATPILPPRGTFCVTEVTLIKPVKVYRDGWYPISAKHE